MTKISEYINILVLIKVAIDWLMEVISLNIFL